MVVVEENRIGEKGMKVMEDSIESELVENEKIWDKNEGNRGDSKIKMRWTWET